ncbi:hypothetical protein FW774_05855 [Pedobacter sp. BS3]|uniref:hypothetical protein n=1 Tax=Pedobacter sp. BS3 TaxID=2567937 RepID=UPI0011EC822D|nr:hypothetical protein [Pedobacter sp. BS3]TZF84511.1 hypothetical protein FW774_05855 [Pedobacter sp. BS3]
MADKKISQVTRKAPLGTDIFIVARVPGGGGTAENLTFTINDLIALIPGLNFNPADYIPVTQKGAANGVATLDANGKVPAEQLEVVGAFIPKGGYDALNNIPNLPDPDESNNGWTYIITVEGQVPPELSGNDDEIDLAVGDYLVSNGTTWFKVPQELKTTLDNVLATGDTSNRRMTVGGITVNNGDVQLNGVQPSVPTDYILAIKPDGTVVKVSTSDIGGSGGGTVTPGVVEPGTAVFNTDDEPWTVTVDLWIWRDESGNIIAPEDPATLDVTPGDEDYPRIDILQGNSDGVYSWKEGEATEAADEPDPDEGYIKLRSFIVTSSGASGQPVPVGNFAKLNEPNTFSALNKFLNRVAVGNKSDVEERINRAFQLLGTDAVLRVGRFTDTPAIAAPSVELISYTLDGTVQRFFWDFFIDGDNNFCVRNRLYGGVADDFIAFFVDGEGNVTFSGKAKGQEAEEPDEFVTKSQLDAKPSDFESIEGDARDNASIAGYLDAKADLVDGLIPASQLPGFVDDVLEGTYVDSTTFNDSDGNPYTPETGKIYVDTDTNITYRWSGSAYISIGSDLALGETSSTAYRGDRGKIAYDHSQTTGNPHGTTIADISGLQSAIDAKLTGTLAADADLQTQTTPSEDNKFVSRRGLIYFWNWLKTQTVNIAASWSFTKGLFGTATAKNSHVTVAANTSTNAQINLAPSSTDYTGTESGAVWNNAGELKFYDGTNVNALVKALSNALLSGSTNRSLSVNQYGDISANDEEIEGFVMDTDVIDAITGATYTSDRATITPDDDKVMYLGQMYDDGTYTYLAIDDNEVRRW